VEGVPSPITFAGGTLDRASARRTDEAWVSEARDRPDALAVVGGRLGVLLADGAPALVALEGREPVALLGLREDGVPVWAAEATESDELTDLRGAAPGLSDADAGLLAYAQSMLYWHRRDRFCGTCGQPNRSSEGGFVLTCPIGHVRHPRTDPVVIMLVVDGDRALLGRQASWPPGRYSALAGFVEPGESLETAVAREVEEEAGVIVGEVTYRGSQPWPFPASLMLGFQAEYVSGEIAAADDELEDARWFTRAELEAAAAADDGAWLLLPPRMAIARRLVDAWLADG
jgi:NAD+ diphosphatase